MALVLRRLLFGLLIAALLPYGNYAISDTKLENVTDHTHAEVKPARSENHEHDHEHGDRGGHESEDHSHSYTHSHGQGQPEHTHDDSHKHEMVTCGCVFAVVNGSGEIVHINITEEEIIFPESLLYSKPNLDSIFRPPIAQFL